MASRHSSAASHSRSSISAVSRGDTYLSETHSKLRRSAAVGQASPHPLLVPQSGTDHHPQHHTGCVSPPSGNYMGGGVARTHSCAASQLAVGFIIIGPAPRNPQLIRFALSSCLKTLSSRLNTKKGFAILNRETLSYYVNAVRRCRLHSFVLLLNDNLACCTVRELEDVDALNRSRDL